MKKNSLPTWIILYGAFLGIFGLAVGIAVFIQPTTFFNDFSAFSEWQSIRYVTYGWALRSAAAGLAMLIALGLRSPGAIAAVFCMRFATELGDLYATVTTGHGTLGMSVTVLSLIWIVFFLLPEALAARWGFKETIHPTTYK